MALSVIGVEFGWGLTRESRALVMATISEVQVRSWAGVRVEKCEVWTYGEVTGSGLLKWMERGKSRLCRGKMEGRCGIGVE